MANFYPPISETSQPILMKLENENYFRRVPHEKCDFCSTTWVVWTNTQFATVKFLSLTFFGSFTRSSHRWTDLTILYTTVKTTKYAA